MILWSDGPARSRDKLSMLHSHLQKTYEHETRQGGYLLWKFQPLKDI